MLFIYCDFTQPRTESRAMQCLSPKLSQHPTEGFCLSSMIWGLGAPEIVSVIQTNSKYHIAVGSNALQPLKFKQKIPLK